MGWGRGIRGEGRGKKGKGLYKSRNMYKGPMDKDNQGQGRGEDRMWEVGVGRAGESNGEK